ncbi:MAG: pilus assembly protein [Planctomycetales bacterium]|nr:pilus assembly protein [Planctomycetales bacterium]
MLPIIFAMLLGAVDFSRANMIRNTLDNAAFEAARFATIPGATSAEITAIAQQTLDILSIQNATITVIPATIAGDTERVTVEISVPLRNNLYASSQLLSGITITESCSLTKEQFAVQTLE